MFGGRADLDVVGYGVPLARQQAKSRAQTTLQHLSDPHEMAERFFLKFKEVNTFSGIYISSCTRLV